MFLKMSKGKKASTNVPSTYFKNLDTGDKELYLQKLTLANGQQFPDPYTVKDNEWSDDVSLLPDITNLDLVNYLINTPSQFTRENVKAYKSLEAYNFYLNGHVQDVYHYGIAKTDYCFIKSTVLPSQRQGQKENLYDVWCALHKTGWVLSANCSCMAGLGSVCSHVAALLFKLVAATQLELNKVLCTETLCSWKKSRKRAYPRPLHLMNFKRPKPGEKLPTVDTPFEGTLTGYSNADPVKFCTEKQRENLEKLKKIAPHAVVLTSVSLWTDQKLPNDSDTDTGDETEENGLPEPLTFIFNPLSINETDKEIQKAGVEKYNEYKNTHFLKQYNNLINITKFQNDNDVWSLHRAGRITASISKQAFSTNIESPSKSFVQTVLQYTKNVDVPATKYGHQMEPIARKAYFEKVKNDHKNFHLDQTGLHVDEENPCLGASPDGIIECDCHGRGLLEIKCPFKYGKSLQGWREDKNCPIDNTGKMKKNHSYFFQIQHQMMITKTNYCDFFVYSKGKKEDDQFLVRMLVDYEFIKILKEKLLTVFDKVILPELVSRKNDPNNKLEDKLYCSCRRPAFQPMIACENESCSIEWYHYVCVNIKRAPTGNWICPSCCGKK